MKFRILLILFIALPGSLLSKPSAKITKGCFERSEKQIGLSTCWETIKWGSDTVKYYHYDNEDNPDLVQIFDARGRLAFEVRGNTNILPPQLNTRKDKDESYEPTLRDLNGDGIEELLIVSWSGGAYCCYTDFVFDHSSGIRNILIWYGEEFRLYKGTDDPLQHLKGKSGPPQLVVEDDSISHINGTQHGPTVPRLFNWNRKYFVDAAEEFSSFFLGHPDDTEKDIEAEMSKYKSPMDDQFFLDLLTYYYAQAILGGQEIRARAFLHKIHADHWLKEKGEIVRAAVKRKVCIRSGNSQKRILRASDWPKGKCNFEGF
jgi:hypothetical protein